MRAKQVFAMAMVLALSGCASTDEQLADAAKYHDWQLMSVDGEDVRHHQASLSFIDALQLNGFSGCNDFFAASDIREQRLEVTNLGMTYKQCNAALTGTEQALLATLKSAPTVRLGERQMTLSGEHVLTFKRTTP